MATEEVYLDHSGAEIDACIDDVDAAKGTSASLAAAMTAESTARADADAALQTAVDGKAALSEIYGLGTNIYAAQGNLKDLDTYTTVGRYYAGVSVTQYIANKPLSSTTAGFQLTVEQNSASTRLIQTVTYNSTESGILGAVYKRWYTSQGWSAWYKFEGTAVS